MLTPPQMLHPSPAAGSRFGYGSLFGYGCETLCEPIRNPLPTLVRHAMGTRARHVPVTTVTRDVPVTLRAFGAYVTLPVRYIAVSRSVTALHVTVTPIQGALQGFV